VAVYVLGCRLKGPFLGVFCAITLAFNYWYFTISSQVLIDGSLLVFCCVYMVSLLKLNEKGNLLRYQVGVGLWALLIILLKWPGVLVVPFTLTYYLLGREGVSAWDRIKKFLIPFSIMMSGAAFLLMNNEHQLGQVYPWGQGLDLKNLTNIWPRMKALSGLALENPLGFMMMFVGGLFCLARERKTTRVLLISWFFVFFLGISLIEEINKRYYFLVLPCMLIISGFALECAINILEKKGFLLGYIRPLAILLIFMFYGILMAQLQPLFEQFGCQFTGYRDAGVLVRKITQPDSLVLATSVRQMRYYTGINYTEFGGRIIPFRHSKKGFEDFLSEEKRPIILVIDRWDKLQPPWIRGEGIEYFRRQGFRLVHVVNNFYPSSPEGWQMIPVVWIFERNE
jgi:4-amino-4-deoxy-L-arabinose transferase-like glycosyltransferase